MKINTLKAAVIGALMVPLTAIHAEEAAPAETSDWSISANVGLYSDYIFRGYTQTENEPALQGGFDVSHSSGFYIGTWASNVDWVKVADLQKSNSVEVDLYGGFAFNVGGVDLDIGLLQFWYPGTNKTGANEADATEIYAGAGYDFGFASTSVYYYHVLSTDAWGFADADGSQYLTLDVDVPLGSTPLTLSGHVGHQEIDGSANSNCDYTDWKANLDYAFNDNYSIGAFYTDTDMEDSCWTSANGTKLGDAVGGAYISASF
jgi:uncharacterized protein (TIGR02001 family)